MAMFPTDEQKVAIGWGWFECLYNLGLRVTPCDESTGRFDILKVQAGPLRSLYMELELTLINGRK